MSLGLGAKINKSDSEALWNPRKLGSALKLWFEPLYGIKGQVSTPPGNNEQISEWLDLSSSQTDNTGKAPVITHTTTGDTTANTSIRLDDVTDIHIGSCVTAVTAEHLIKTSDGGAATSCEITVTAVNVATKIITVNASVTVVTGRDLVFTFPGFDFNTDNGGFLDCTGAQKLVLPQQQLTATEDHTVWLSIYFKNGTAINTSDIFVNDIDDSSNEFFRVQNTTQIRLKIGGSVTSFNLDSSIPGTSSGTLQDETWYTIGWERTGTANTLYVNGVAHGPNTRGNTFSFDRYVAGNGCVVGPLIVMQGRNTTASERAYLLKYFERFQNAPS
tara:strand:+ start:775 stop:1764 length:990 start_codon:yes stop_codon:yes gene_type:complete